MPRRPPRTTRHPLDENRAPPREQIQRLQVERDSLEAAVQRTREQYNHLNFNQISINELADQLSADNPRLIVAPLQTFEPLVDTEGASIQPSEPSILTGHPFRTLAAAVDAANRRTSPPELFGTSMGMPSQYAPETIRRMLEINPDRYEPHHSLHFNRRGNPMSRKSTKDRDACAAINIQDLKPDRLAAANSLLFRYVRNTHPARNIEFNSAVAQLQDFIGQNCAGPHQAPLARAMTMFFMMPSLLAEVGQTGRRILPLTYLSGTRFMTDEIMCQMSPRNRICAALFLYSIKPRVRERFLHKIRFKLGGALGFRTYGGLPDLLCFTCRECRARQPIFLSVGGGALCALCQHQQIHGAVNPSHNADPIRICLNGVFNRPTNQHYLGLELEYESSSRNFTSQIARQLREAAPNQLICKHDGSLQGGAEICTIPMTLDEHKGMWEKLCSIPDWEQGAICDESPRPGLHVHISRKPAGLMQMARYGRFLQGPGASLTEYVAGRGDNAYAHYRPYMSIQQLLRELHRGDETDKYNVVNVRHPATIEVRAFKSTKHYDMLMARTEYTQAVMEFVARMKAEELTVDRFLHWLSATPRRSQYKHLSVYLKGYKPLPGIGDLLPGAVATTNTLGEPRTSQFNQEARVYSDIANGR